MIVAASLILFWTFTGVVITTYVLYPASLLVLAQILPAPKKLPQHSTTQFGKISIIICAHNEADVMEDKLRSIANQMWSGAYEIIVANDGSTDRTSDLARSMTDHVHNLRVLDFDRIGKWFALNAAAKLADGDILVFTDADTIWEENALAALLNPLADEKIGCVAGNIISRKSQRSSAAGFDRLFRSYESAIRKSEEYLSGCVSADGGLFAIRTGLFEPVPPGVTDDFYISTGAVLSGTKIAFQPNAIAYEYAISGERKNLRRRIRITVRGLTSLFRRHALLNPFKFGYYSVALLFHKFLRRLSAVFILALLPLSLVLSTHSIFFAVIAVAQLAVYGAMIVSLMTGISVPVIGKLSMAALHVSGLAIGFLLFISGKRFDRWAPSRSN